MRSTPKHTPTLPGPGRRTISGPLHGAWLWVCWCVGAWTRRWAAVGLAWLLCLPGWAHAIELGSRDQRVSLSGHMSVTLVDAAQGEVPQRPQDLEFVRAKGNPAAGFGPEVMWVKFDLHARDEGGAGEWLLEITPAYLNHLAVYVETPHGLQLVGRAGTEHPHVQRQLRHRNGVFILNLKAGEPAQTHHVRVASRTTRMLGATLHRPKAFAEAIQGDLLLQGVFFGGILIAMMISLFLGQWLRETVQFYYAAYVSVSGFLQLMALGFGQQWLFPEQIGIYNSTVAAAMVLQALFGAQVLRITRVEVHLPRLAQRYWQTMWVLTAVLLPVALAGAYDIVSPIIQVVYSLQAVFSIGVSIAIWRRGEAAAKFFLAAFSCLLLSVLLFLPLNLGWLPLNFWTQNMLQISMFIHLILMNIAVARYVKVLRDEADGARDRLLATAERSAVELEDQVNARTAELQGALLAANEAGRAKTEFLGRVSHDLRTPLTAIIGYAQLMQTEEHGHQRRAGIIGKSAQHMLTLINDLIEYARGASSDKLNLAPTYLHGALDSVAQDARALAQAQGNRFELVLAGSLPNVVMTDGARLRQVLMNLLQNATRFTQNGQITLRVEAIESEGSADHQTLSLRFQVEDNGCGIPASDLTQVFNPFFRSHPPPTSGPKGLGLGLSIVDTWVKRMHGSVTLHSEEGKGTLVTLTIPTRTASEQDMSLPQMVAGKDAMPALDGGGRRIWVVEDTVEIRDLLSEELRRCGFEVVLIATGQEFLNRLKLIGATPPSLILTDHQMPGADGDEVLKASRAQWPGVPVLLLSATQQTMESLGRAGSSGFDASLTKPVNLLDLRATLARVLGLQLGDAPPPPTN